MSREFVIHTGIEGAKAIDRAIKIDMYLVMIAQLKCQKEINSEQADNLCKMLNATDYDYNLAVESIKSLQASFFAKSDSSHIKFLKK